MKNMKELDSLHLNAAGSMASHFNIYSLKRTSICCCAACFLATIYSIKYLLLMVITTSTFLKDATAYSLDTFSYLLDTST